MPENCQGHGTQRICTESGKLANEYCPADKVKTVSYGGVIPKEQLKLWNTIKPSKSSSEKIEETCTIHTKPAENPKPAESTKPTEVKNEVTNTNTVKPENTTKPQNNTTGGKDNSAGDGKDTTTE